MADIENIVDVVLNDGLDDWVMIDTLIWSARQTAEKSGDDYKRLALDALSFLLREGLAEVGDIEGGFKAWTSPIAETVDRVVRGLDAVDWTPAGGFCWISNTPKGDQRIKQKLGS